jgi:hypothetical protein
MWAHLTFHQIETLEVKSSAFMSTWELNNPIIHILLSKDTWHQITQKACQNMTMWFLKRIKRFFGHVHQAMLSGSSLLKEHEVSVLPYSPSVGLSLALQISKLHGFKCDNCFFKFNNLWVQFHVYITHSSRLRIIEMKFQTSSNWQLWYWVLQQVKI